MDVEFSDEQNRLRESAREFLAAECPMSHVRLQMEDASAAPDTLWSQMAELGWMGLVIDEDYGGAGLEFVDLAVLLEEVGRCLLPAPYFSSVVLGGGAISLAGSTAQKQRWLPRIASGDLVVALAQLEATGDWSADGITMGQRMADGCYRLNGVKTFVRDAQSANLLLVPVRDDSIHRGSEGISLLAIDARSEGVAISPFAFTDATRQICEVAFTNAQFGPEAVLDEPGAGWRTLDRLHDIARVSLSAEACGGAQAMLDMSVAYAKTREQFGRPIGTFQAIQHKCADMLIQVEGTRSATYYAAWALDNAEPDAHAAACMAKSYASSAYTRACATAIQIHGGLGYTWEQDFHLYYKRAKADELYLGSPTFNRELVAKAIIDTVSPARSSASQPSP